MPVSVDPKKIEELLSRGVAEAIDRASLEAKLKSGRQLRVKLGIDPTSPHLHLGRAVSLWKLKDFQDLGHQIVLIIGDFTGTIGDASDKDSERPMLTQEVVDQNLKTYAEQAGKILDMSKVELRRNSEWLATLPYAEVLAQAAAFSVNDFTARELIAKRLAEGKRVGLHETLYPLLQGYDSVAVKADVELGGTDQKFNLLAGRTMQRRYGQEPQDILMSPIVEGTDGRKMSSSWGNTIALDDEPRLQFQKAMGVADRSIETYARLTTRMPLLAVEALAARLAVGENPRDVKKTLAFEIVRSCHGEAAAKEAQAYFEELLGQGNVPANVAEASVAGLGLFDALVAAGLAESKSDARRVVEQKGVKVNGETCADPARVLASGDTLERGKGRAVRAA
jgi:tyrosyl-tRNA synthetase